MTEDTTNPAPDPTPAPQATPKASPKAEEAARYAVYDKIYLRFVGGTHETRKAASAAAKDAGVKSFEIREV